VDIIGSTGADMQHAADTTDSDTHADARNDQNGSGSRSCARGRRAHKAARQLWDHVKSLRAGDTTM
jgi:hypothetical protein